MSHGADVKEFLKDFQENVRMPEELTFPIEVELIDIKAATRRRLKDEVGQWVAVRPCDGDKTYLGIHLGDLNVTPLVSYHLKSKHLTISPHTNPAIYVPDLKRVVWGMESWWGTIDSPEGL